MSPGDFEPTLNECIDQISAWMYLNFPRAELKQNRSYYFFDLKSNDQ